MSDATDEQLLRSIAARWQQSRPTMLARVDVLERAVRAELEGAADVEQRRTARRDAHRIAGSAALFGFPEASRLARGLEELLEADLPHERVPEAAAQVLRLREVLEGEPVGPSAPAPRPVVPSAAGRHRHDPGWRTAQRHDPVRREGRGRGVLLLGEDVRFATHLADALRERGAPVTSAATAARDGHETTTPRDDVATHTHPDPAVIVVDGGRGHAAATEPGTAVDASVRDALAELDAWRSAPETPVVLVTDADTQVDRVAAVQAGVRRFLRRTAPQARIADAVEELLAELEGDTTRVLACDDDPAVLGVLEDVLGAAGHEVVAVADERGFWSALAATEPELVLLDVDMPHVSGFDLCRLLRATPANVTLPVMFLTSAPDRACVQRAFDAGADDVISKPIVPAELRSRVENRLNRVRLLRQLAETDPLTGLANRRACDHALARQLAMAERYEQPAAFALLDLDRFKGINDRHGHAAGDEVLQQLGQALRRHFRGGDVAARWGGEELAIAMYGMSRHDAVQRVAELLEEFRDQCFVGGGGEAFRVTFSAGIAEYPTDGSDTHQLYLAADRALARAKLTGRDRVLTLEPGTRDDPELRDVVCVEDDETIGPLLLDALRTRGYRAELLTDGAEANRRLVGPGADLHPRVILLDVDLPALSGLDLLEGLRDAGRLADTRVVMLTGRSHDGEVLAALRGGASDHVAKPFSVPILLERVRHALRA